MSVHRLSALGLTLVLGALAGWVPASPLSAADLRAVPAVAPAQAFPETVGTPGDPALRGEQMRLLQERLSGEKAEGALVRPTILRITEAERFQIDYAGSAERRYLVGVSKPVGVAMDFANARYLGLDSADLTLGSARGQGAGFIWTAAFEAPGATALRLYLSGVDLPAGAELYVYNLAGQAFGPYTGRGPLDDGDLYTNTVRGDQILLQLHAPEAEALRGFTIAEVGVMGTRFTAGRIGDPRSLDVNVLLSDASNLCSYNADCVVNAACQSSPVVNIAKDAVAGMLFKSGGSWYICTGGLVADTVSTSVIPYFLTAHHCISRGAEASSLETYFDYKSTCTGADCDQSIYDTAGNTVGATIKSTGTSSDWSLLQLASTPVSSDGTTTYLGWSTTAVANTNNTALYRISHPQGAPQAYSEQVVDTGKGTCQTLPRGAFIYSRDTLGATEGGSSGSPVVNGAGQIVGQLYGACGTNLNNVCDSASNATVDGAFAAYYTSVQPFLNPGGGGPTCKPKGDACSANADCCSNKCVGRGSAKTCK